MREFLFHAFEFGPINVGQLCRMQYAYNTPNSGSHLQVASLVLACFRLVFKLVVFCRFLDFSCYYLYITVSPISFVKPKPRSDILSHS